MRIDTDALNVLERSTVSGNKLILPPEQLERSLYMRVNKALEAAGGKWTRSIKAHVFPEDVADVIDAMILTGQVTHERKEFDAFYTPKIVSEQVIDEAGILKGMTVLEPSAGLGALATPAAEQAGTQALVYCIEKSAKSAAHLRASGFPYVDVADFLDIPVIGDRFDRVVMNPPFSKQQDIKHVMHALDFLKPNGRLVAIMSASVQFRDNKLTRDFRDLVVRRGGVITPLPAESFKMAGTLVNTVMVTVG